MNPALIPRLGRVATHVLFSVALIGTSHTFQIYYVTSKLKVDSVEGLAPANGRRSAEVIGSKLSPKGDAALVRRLMHYEQQQATMLHEGWLNDVQIQVLFLRTQLIAWLVMLVASLVAVLALHRKPNA